MAAKQGRNITIVGASGHAGRPILDALMAVGIHKVSVITRPESDSAFPENVTVHRGSYSDESFVSNALKNQHVLITALAWTSYDFQLPLFRAAAQSGVPWVVPTEYGLDPSAPLNDHIGLMREKKKYRDYVEELGVSSWIGVTNGIWFDFTMRFKGLGIDLQNKTMRKYDDGSLKVNYTTLRRTGESVAAILSLPDDELAKHKNGWVYLSSFHISQNDMLASALRATGSTEAEWKISTISSKDAVQHAKDQMAQGVPMAMVQLLLALNFAPDMGGDYEHRVVDYKKLGLEPENLDEAMRGLVKELGA